MDKKLQLNITMYIFFGVLNINISDKTNFSQIHKMFKSVNTSKKNIPFGQTENKMADSV